VDHHIEVCFPLEHVCSVAADNVGSLFCLELYLPG
jgi:hypothetical protein